MKRIVISILILITTSTYANNITISNISLTGKDVVAKTIRVKFDVSWENSWRTNAGPSNWDAAWIFAKVRKKTSEDWANVGFSYINGTGLADGHLYDTTTTVINSVAHLSGTNFSRGVMVYSNTDLYPGITPMVSHSNIELEWNYLQIGLSDADSLEICLFAIEMVYIPEGSFPLGSNLGTEQDKFQQSQIYSGVYSITSSTSGSSANLPNSLYIPGAPSPWTLENSLNPGQYYPNGFKAFYCMKHEITQGQYTEYLNKLSPTDANARYMGSGPYREGIFYNAAFHYYYTNSPHLPLNSLNIDDLKAYLAWIGLRPMSEMEYEKVCKGPASAPANSFAWGTSLPFPLNGINNFDAANEIPSDSLANCNYSFPLPIRVGSFGNNSPGRFQTGASYYGVMELSGNLAEIVVNCHTPAGRDFLGLTYPIYFPASNTAYGLRGGSFLSNSYDQLYVADRSQISFDLSNREPHVGARGVISF
ncbi:MAG: SUMF1/EgtB/PvdO family nonheme iron enzyme [Chitinophagales bacterium]|nr:SUMF1/EgtB/PvdO family nonheme iron enzyme [Chitinophagales bacterium]